MKYPVIALLLLLFQYMHSMELEELEKVPFLENKIALVTAKKDIVINHHKQVRYGDFPEKVYLLKRIPGLRTSKNVQKEIITYMVKTDCNISYALAVDYQRAIGELYSKIDTLTAEKNRCPDIKINVDRCTNTAYGACSGGCCGGTVGLSIEFIAAAINAYAWCCCSVSHSKIIWDTLVWGLPICTCCGCVIGSCCVASGLYDKIKYV